MSKTSHKRSDTMNKKIAVALNNTGETETMHESSIIKVYLKEKNQWQVVNEFQFTLKGLTVVKSIREHIFNLIETLGECKVIVAKELSGVPSTVLGMAGFTILEVEGRPEDLLDDVADSIEEYEAAIISETEKKEINITPISTNREGYYYINLKEIQSKNSGVTSKQALLNFLHNTTFYELIIICSHVPNWLEGELKRINMKSNITRINSNEYKITVHNKTCYED